MKNTSKKHHNKLVLKRFTHTWIITCSKAANWHLNTELLFYNQTSRNFEVILAVSKSKDSILHPKWIHSYVTKIKAIAAPLSFRKASKGVLHKTEANIQFDLLFWIMIQKVFRACDMDGNFGCFQPQINRSGQLSHLVWSRAQNVPPHAGSGWPPVFHRRIYNYFISLQRVARNQPNINCDAFRFELELNIINGNRVHITIREWSERESEVENEFNEKPFQMETTDF